MKTTNVKIMACTFIFELCNLDLAKIEGEGEIRDICVRSLSFGFRVSNETDHDNIQNPTDEDVTISNSTASTKEASPAEQQGTSHY